MRFSFLWQSSAPARNASRPSQPLRCLVRRRRRHHRLSPSHANGDGERGADALTSPLAPTEGVFGELLPLPTPAHRSHSQRGIVGQHRNLRATYTATTIAATAATLRGRGRVADFVEPRVSVLSLRVPAIPPPFPPTLPERRHPRCGVSFSLSPPSSPSVLPLPRASDNRTPRPPPAAQRR